MRRNERGNSAPGSSCLLCATSCAVTMVEHFQPMDQEMKELRPPLIAAKQKVLLCQDFCSAENSGVHYTGLDMEMQFLRNMLTS